MEQLEQREAENGSIAVHVDQGDDFSGLKGDTVEEKIETAIRSDAVVVFGRSTCPCVLDWMDPALCLPCTTTWCLYTLHSLILGMVLVVFI